MTFFIMTILLIALSIVISKTLRTFARGSSVELEARIKNTSGEYHWFLCRFQPILDIDQSISRWYGSFTNIQAQKNHSIELENSILIRDQFLSIASHEFKTPLTALKIQIGMRQRLIDKRIVDVIDMNYFQKIVLDDKKQIDRIVRLVDDMLDISRIKSGKLSFNFAEVEIDNFMTDVLSRFVPEFTERNCKLIYNSIPSTICFWDHHRIEQVMINLLSNALKYGRNKDVEVLVEQEPNFVKILVKDQGEGISSHNQKKIFDLFERANLDQSVSGLGLGLFIVKQIVESHQGSMEVISSEEQGSTFIVKLPTNAIV